MAITFSFFSEYSHVYFDNVIHYSHSINGVRPFSRTQIIDIGRPCNPKTPLAVKIEAGKYKGSVGRVLYVKVDKVHYELISPKNKTIKRNISTRMAKFIVGFNDSMMKYVCAETGHVPDPVNKFGQTLTRGDWVVGCMAHRRFGIGRVTRWTQSNVWAVPHGNLENVSNEFKFDTIKETFLLPANEDYEEYLSFAALQGWDGKL